ncbi:MAG: hypothetical protein CSB33_00985 [Desulfobacterales bacterium]|nr:MAG: hypothetical protein CSB33_00985 [Desulfobacterales bacterium]
MRKIVFFALFAGIMLIGASAMAHTPLFSCYDNGDKTVTCEGGFSDGSSASGVKIFVYDGSGNVLQETKLNEFSEVTFKKPEGDYSVRFDAGEGHKLDVPGAEIVE